MKGTLDSIMDAFEANGTIEYALWRLQEMNKRSVDGFVRREDSPELVVCLQDMIKAKRKLGKSVKKDKEMLEGAKKLLQEYFVTLDRDEQIKVLKYVQP